MAEALYPTAFNGDADVAELHAFFQPEFQFDGDTRWSFGTSLKSAYVNSFEFMNHAPVVQLWRDSAAAVQAVSRLSLGTGEWFYLAAPGHRTEAVGLAMILQADAAFALLSDHQSWATVRYASHAAEIGVLERSGYTRAGDVEVFMSRSLGEPIEEVPCPAGVAVSLLDPSDAALVQARAMAQVDAFSGADPTLAAQAWMTRSLPHQLSYGGPGTHPHLIAVDDVGTVLAFADPFLDHKNKIGEFEPVGTRQAAQRRGLGKLVLAKGLSVMRERGMRQAVVRTGADNAAAIAAYKSVGFEITDRLVRYRRPRAGSRPASHLASGVN